LKISLQDKKAVGAFLDKKSYDGRVLVSDGGRLTAKWGSLPLIAKWDKKGKLVIISSEDRGVRKAQGLILETRP
tara:strand:- start:469 stop:690 length:222 start_codon:yes stop_codon:yes gene_type:complete